MFAHGTFKQSVFCGAFHLYLLLYPGKLDTPIGKGRHASVANHLDR